VCSHIHTHIEFCSHSENIRVLTYQYMCVSVICVCCACECVCKYVCVNEMCVYMRVCGRDVRKCVYECEVFNVCVRMMYTREF